MRRVRFSFSFGQIRWPATTICVTRDQFAEVFGSQNAAASASSTDGQQPPAPAAMPASAEADDIGDTSSTTLPESVPITPELQTPANDNQSNTDQITAREEEVSEQLAEPEQQAPTPLEAANDNSPPETTDLPQPAPSNSPSGDRSTPRPARLPPSKIREALNMQNA
jgi:hypothetical protein